MQQQASLFQTKRPTRERVALPDADIELVTSFFDPSTSDRLLAELLDAVAWEQETIRIHGQAHPVPRLTAWYGDPGRPYAYSGITMTTHAWTAALCEVKAAVEAETGLGFNGALLNLYRSGRDSVAWHSDDERELGTAPIIASVSLGATRTFQLRHRSVRELRHQLDLPSGSLLVMRGPTQRHWRHQVPKTARPVGPRVNLTFRQVAPQP
ncbi:MAG: 2OG-Fe(II) oxygenase [Acidimicrobiales bacterium]|nr:2OG-Fe(II) oxygenase [Acidimicrobiales bacterium]